MAGAAAGLCGAIVSCCVSAMFATSSFVVTTARVSEALLLGSLTTALLAIPAIAGDRGLVIVAIFLCVTLAGVWQVIFGLAGMIFIVNMSRPVIGRVLLGHDIQSKRIRPAKDVEILRETGSQRAVVLLDGVLFFGNAEDLSTKVKQLFQQAHAVALDMRGAARPRRRARLARHRFPVRACH